MGARAKPKLKLKPKPPAAKMAGLLARRVGLMSQDFLCRAAVWVV